MVAPDRWFCCLSHGRWSHSHPYNCQGVYCRYVCFDKLNTSSSSRILYRSRDLEDMRIPWNTWRSMAPNWCQEPITKSKSGGESVPVSLLNHCEAVILKESENLPELWKHLADLRSPPKSSYNKHAEVIVTSLYWMTCSGHPMILMIAYMHYGIMYITSTYFRCL